MNMLRLLVAVVFAVFSLAVDAQGYPNKPVRIIVPYPAGGGLDVLARGIAEQLSDAWKQPVVIENRSGASTIIGSQIVVNAPADGHTLLLTTDASVTSNPHLFPRLPFDPMRDLAPVTQVALFDLMIVAHPSLPASSIKELLTHAEQTQIPVPYASFGNASQPHIFFEAVSRKYGMKLNHIPYKGMADAQQATVAGDVKLALLGVGAAWELVRAGRIRALAVARATRSPLLPDVPTLAEIGWSEFDPKPWFGLFAPRGTPLVLRQKIWADVSQVLSSKSTAQRIVTSRGFEVKVSNPEAFESDLEREWSQRAHQIRLSGVRAE